MNRQNKYYWLISIIVLLIITNIATVTAVLIKAKQTKTEVNNRKNWREKNNIKPFLMSELNLTTQQYDSLETERKNYFNDLKFYNNNIFRLKTNIGNEIFKTNTNYIVVSQYTDSVNFYNNSIEQLNIKHFSNVKTILDTTQQQKFLKMLRCQHKKTEHNNRKNRNK